MTLSFSITYSILPFTNGSKLVKLEKRTRPDNEWQTPQIQKVGTSLARQFLTQHINYHLVVQLKNRPCSASYHHCLAINSAAKISSFSSTAHGKLNCYYIVQLKNLPTRFFVKLTCK
jgi:hypothetical protein